MRYILETRGNVGNEFLIFCKSFLIIVNFTFSSNMLVGLFRSFSCRWNGSFMLLFSAIVSTIIRMQSVCVCARERERVILQ